MTRRKVGIAATVAVLTLAVAAVPAAAWTLIRNNFGSDPDNPGVPNSCTDVSPWYCVEWPLDHGCSSDVFVYLAASLNTHPAGETVDMKQQARNAFGRWNDVPACEPWLLEAATINDATGASELRLRDRHLARRTARGSHRENVFLQPVR
jgi:hypothetical protein